MNQELAFIIHQLEDAYNGDPWFGRSVKKLLEEVDERMAVERPNGQHSPLELLYHMILWREFTISRLGGLQDRKLEYFEKNDWQVLDHGDTSLWKKGMKRLEETQTELLQLLRQFNESKLEDPVKERPYNFRTLLHGLTQHDIYHAGQIAYLKKLFEKG